MDIQSKKRGLEFWDNLIFCVGVFVFIVVWFSAGYSVAYRVQKVQKMKKGAKINLPLSEISQNSTPSQTLQESSQADRNQHLPYWWLSEKQIECPKSPDQ